MAAVHPGGLNASQSLAFFRANDIPGELVKRQRNGREVRAYACDTQYLGGWVGACVHRILATPEQHVIRNAP
jgi:hypothetical protein